ncbi:MAG TPA: hypothetical protein VEU51_09715 [Candidatus Acidoferrales bacterium]|nr:hypothetical protein [Candidatus Acidoferrales bacterium]
MIDRSTAMVFTSRSCRVGRLGLRAATAFAALAFMLSFAAGVNASVVSLARFGDVAPSSGGATFTGFDEPMADSSGDVVFGADLSDGGFGIYFIANGGSVTKIARDGDSISGATLSTHFDGPAINDARTIFFVNREMTGGFANALFEKPDHASVAAVIKQGDAAPGTSGVFETFDDMGVNPTKGDIAIIASYTEDHGSTFKIGVWLRELINKNKGTTQVVNVVKSGDALPGSNGTLAVNSDPECIDGPWVGDNRLVAFIADCIDGGTNEGSMWARKGNAAIKTFVLLSDTPPAALGGSIDGINVGRPGLVNNMVALNFEISGGSTTGALVTKTLGGKTSKAQVLVKNGDAAPGTSGTFSTTDGVSAPTFNSAGDVEFHSEIVGDAVNFIGEFAFHTKGKLKGMLDSVVLAGDTKPGGGVWENTEEGSISSRFITFLDDTGIDAEAGVFRADIP